jgi:hypothetical protein
MKCRDTFLKIGVDNYRYLRSTEETGRQFFSTVENGQSHLASQSTTTAHTFAMSCGMTLLARHPHS